MTAKYAKRLEVLVGEIKTCSDRLSKLDIEGKNRMLMACDEVMATGNRLLKIHSGGDGRHDDPGKNEGVKRGKQGFEGNQRGINIPAKTGKCGQ